MLKLSLPAEPTPKKPKKKKKKSQPSTNDILELFMDKLAVWQLVDSLEPPSSQTNAPSPSTRDWTQSFCEDVVEPLCALSPVTNKKKKFTVV